MRVPAILLVVALLTVSGCGSEDEPAGAKPTAEGTPLPVATVQGRLVEVGGPPGTEDRPIPGTLTLKGSNGSTVRAEVDEDGRFQVQTNPGQYEITGRSPRYGDGKTECITARAVTTLVLGETVSVDVICQVR